MEDLRDIQVRDVYTSKHNGGTYVYLNQSYQNIEVSKAIININILPNGAILNVGNRFVSNLSQKVNTTTATISAERALKAVLEQFEIPLYKHFNCKAKLRIETIFSTLPE